MAEKVIITISTTGQAVTVDTQAASDGTTRHLRLHEAVEGRLGDHVAELAPLPIEEPITLPMPAEQARGPHLKPWQTSTDSPKGLNFQPEAELHAKMNWV